MSIGFIIVSSFLKIPKIVEVNIDVKKELNAVFASKLTKFNSGKNGRISWFFCKTKKNE